MMFLLLNSVTYVNLEILHWIIFDIEWEFKNIFLIVTRLCRWEAINPFLKKMMSKIYLDREIYVPCYTIKNTRRVYIYVDRAEHMCAWAEPT